MGLGLGVSQQQNQSASNAQQGQSGIKGPIGDAIEGVCIGIGANMSVGNKGVGITIGFTPFGNGCQSIDYGIGDLDIVQIGCDIIITRSLLGITTTEVRKDPKCKPPEPPPPPSPTTPPGEPINYPANTFVHAWFLRVWEAYYPPPDYPFTKKSTDFLFSIQSVGDKYKFTVSQPIGGGTFVTGHGVNEKYILQDYKGRNLVKVGSRWYLQNSDGSLSFAGTDVYGGVNEFTTATLFNACRRATGPFSITPSPGVEEGSIFYFLRFYTGNSDDIFGNGSPASRNEQVTIISCSPFTPSPSPSPPAYFPPKKMEDKCCAATTSMLRKIMKVLAVDEIDKKGILIPNELLAPGGSGVSRVTNYADLQLNLFRTVNRYGIDCPIVVKVKDVNKAKEGDQSIELQFNSPAAALQGLLELAVENKGDAATRLQIQVRLAYAMTRTVKMVAGIGETIREIVKMLGSPFRWKLIRLPLEFDLSCGKTDNTSGKGFGQKSNNENPDDALPPGLEVNDEDSTEAMLPYLLRGSDYQLPVPRFAEESDDLQDFLTKIILLLGRQK